MNHTARTLVAVATYNERENLSTLVEGIFRHLPEVEVLVIDDNSPDGTGEWCDQMAMRDARIDCLHRPSKMGLGSATLAGMRHAIEEGYDFLLTMDADLSHGPQFLPDLLRPFQDTEHVPVDVVIGSRYVSGGGIEGWPWYRRVMSRAINAYARVLLGLPAKDCSGAFRCYRVATLRRLDLDQIQSRGYSYLEELLWRLRQCGATCVEVPITFVDRQLGETKMNMRESFRAVTMISRLGFRNWFGGSARGDGGRMVVRERG